MTPLFLQTEYKQDLASPGLTEQLPEECVREILLRLDAHEDIRRAGNVCALMGGIAKEKRIWRELVQSHFTPAQIAYVVNAKPQLQVRTSFIRSKSCSGVQEIFMRDRAANHKESICCILIDWKACPKPVL